MTAAEMVERMADLGDTADEVAASLRAAGVKGDIGGRCPLAVWAQRQHDDFCQVGTHAVRLWAVDRPDSWATLTPAGRAFVERFDTGEFPDLVAS